MKSIAARAHMLERAVAALSTALSGLARRARRKLFITEVRTSAQANFEVRTSILAIFIFLRET
ncbi:MULTISPECIES: hypothetical protein [unclassified Rhizobium]|uniref:hypothetical protein n=1 Tax=unclassified Rhizobium TaxID=2613769 RepID=UPI001C82FF65|nr:MULTISPECIES: hypothetical protein [unclassified Rhizobium]MBX5222804.1 hypothetical protein [Rhizobium sp. NLR8a]MBX5228275.1 hypothetical protein [Rhizobium sp. NLR9b]MBX5240221.1 hypothetical protein [Rhizobium sp. NLR22b]MBX5289083.1 hypothetical protein [Rhizobium sp. NLR10b]